MFQHIEKTNNMQIKLFQTENDLKPTGFIDDNLINTLKEKYNSDFIAHNGKLVSLKNNRKYNVVFDLSLYELPDGSNPWHYRREDAETICLHVSGFNTRQNWMNFMTTKIYHESTHFSIGRNSKNNNQIEIVQHLDTGLEAKHAGKFNQFSIGVDISQPIDVRHLEIAHKYGYKTEIIDNCGRGSDEDNKILSIDPELVAIAKLFLKDLTDIMNISDKPICKDDKVYSIHDAKNFSICNYTNVNSRFNLSVAQPWSEQLHWSIEEIKKPAVSQDNAG